MECPLLPVSSSSRWTAGACCDPPKHLCTLRDCSTVDRVQIIAGSRGRGGGCGYRATHLLVMGSLLCTTLHSRTHTLPPLSGRNLFRARLSGEQYHLQEHDGDAPDWHAFGCVVRSLISSSLIPKVQRQGGHILCLVRDCLPVVPSNLQGVRPVGQIMDCTDVWEWITEFFQVLEGNVDLWEFLDSSITFRASAILYHRQTNLNSWIQV